MSSEIEKLCRLAETSGLKKAQEELEVIIRGQQAAEMLNALCKEYERRLEFYESRMRRCEKCHGAIYPTSTKAP